MKVQLVPMNCWTVERTNIKNKRMANFKKDQSFKNLLHFLTWVKDRQGAPFLKSEFRDGYNSSLTTSLLHWRQCDQMLKLKVAQVFAKVAQKVVAAVGFSSKMVFYKFAKYLGCFCKKFCHQELSKIAQSGHTDFSSWSCPGKSLFFLFWIFKADSSRNWNL